MTSLADHLVNEAGELGYTAFLHDHAPEENPYEGEILKRAWLGGYMKAWLEEQESKL